MAYLRDLWHFDQSLNPALFYKDYDDLNQFYDMGQATPEMLKKIQINNLKSLYGRKQSYKVLNQFLVKALGDTQATNEDLFAKLVNGINKGWGGIKRDNFNIDHYKRDLENILQQLNTQISSLTGTEGIPASSLTPIINAVEKKDFNAFVAEKGQYLEDVATWVMQQAGLTGINTGAWVSEDAFFNEDFEAQLIEDAMGFLGKGLFNNNKNINNNFLTVKATGYSQLNASEQSIVNKKLQKWVNSIQELNGLKVADGEVQIGTKISSFEQFENLLKIIKSNQAADIRLTFSLSPQLYQELQKLSVNVQSKSNTQRHLANKGRAKYSIQPNDKYYNQLQKFSKTKPVVDETAVTKKEFNTDYEEFSVYVNYNLSRNINKTVYARNEFYLTKEGFADLPTLMEKRGFYIRIEDSVLSYKKFLKNSFDTIYS